MTKTVILTDLVITSMLIDYKVQGVHVFYDLVDEDNLVWHSSDAWFWVEMPDPPIQGNWFILPPEYIPVLLSLQSDADAALTAEYLVEGE